MPNADQHWEPDEGWEAWPEFGTAGRNRVRLRDVETSLPAEDWPNVVVDHPTRGKLRPWRGLFGF